MHALTHPSSMFGIHLTTMPWTVGVWSFRPLRIAHLGSKNSSAPIQTTSGLPSFRPSYPHTHTDFQNLTLQFTWKKSPTLPFAVHPAQLSLQGMAKVVFLVARFALSPLTTLAFKSIRAGVYRAFWAWSCAKMRDCAVETGRRGSVATSVSTNFPLQPTHRHTHTYTHKYCARPRL